MTDTVSDPIIVEVSGDTGIVSRCGIPFAAVVQSGLFHILRGGSAAAVVDDSMSKGAISGQPSEDVGHLTPGLNYSTPLQIDDNRLSLYA